MYEDFETKTSFNYLKDVIKALDEPICILGGWAVFFLVNDNFKETKGRPYLGSRDIDLGFHIKKDISIKELKNSVLNKAIKVIEKKLKFEPHGTSRYFKQINIETGKEVQKGKIIPLYDKFDMYIDPIVDNIPKNFNKIFKFKPIDEPLLNHAFENPNNKEELKEFNKKLWLPKPELLIATKINSLKNRDKEHKKIKDICDIFALLWYSNEKIGNLMLRVPKFLLQKEIRKSLSTIKDEDLKKASEQLDHTTDEIRRVIFMLVHN